MPCTSIFGVRVHGDIPGFQIAINLGVCPSSRHVNVHAPVKIRPTHVEIARCAKPSCSLAETLRCATCMIHWLSPKQKMPGLNIIARDANMPRFMPRTLGPDWSHARPCIQYMIRAGDDKPMRPKITRRHNRPFRMLGLFLFFEGPVGENNANK